MHNHFRPSATMLVVAALLLAMPVASGAQSSGDGFLFQRPTVTLTLAGGLARPSASSEVFDFTSTHLTVKRGDFASLSGSAELGVRLVNRVEALLGASISGRTVDSHMRDWTDTDDREIEQSTLFSRAPMTAGVKVFLTSPSRRISDLVWIPAKFTPYVGAGGGVMYYRFKQTGDFVDFDNLDVFSDTFDSSGWTPMAYGALGIDYTLTPRIGLVTEARYERARGDMSFDFVGFDRIDLSGASVSVGLNFRF